MGAAGPEHHGVHVERGQGIASADAVSGDHWCRWFDCLWLGGVVIISSTTSIVDGRRRRSNGLGLGRPTTNADAAAPPLPPRIGIAGRGIGHLLLLLLRFGGRRVHLGLGGRRAEVDGGSASIIGP